MQFPPRRVNSLRIRFKETQLQLVDVFINLAKSAMVRRSTLIMSERPEERTALLTSVPTETEAAIVIAALEENGIRAESDGPGKGTTFRIRLPFSSPETGLPAS